MIFHPSRIHAMNHLPMTDEEASACAPCEHDFRAMFHAENYVACVRCGVMMWALIETVYCDWTGRAMEGRV